MEVQRLTRASVPREGTHSAACGAACVILKPIAIKKIKTKVVSHSSIMTQAVVSQVQRQVKIGESL